jgi:uncharacterized protein DUF2786
VTSRDSLVRKVRALRQLARGNSNLHERDAATRLATQIVRDYHITEAELREEPAPPPKPPPRRRSRVSHEVIEDDGDPDHMAADIYGPGGFERTIYVNVTSESVAHRDLRNAVPTRPAVLYYTAWGPVSLGCGHAHLSRLQAEACRMSGRRDRTVFVTSNRDWCLFGNYEELRQVFERIARKR